jgi:hypothetical protein
MRENTGEFAGDGSIHHFHNVEVGGEEDVEVALMYLFLLNTCFLGKEPGEGTYKRCANRHRPPLIPGLHNRRINPLNRIRPQLVKIARQ